MVEERRSSNARIHKLGLENATVPSINFLQDNDLVIPVKEMDNSFEFEVKLKDEVFRGKTIWIFWSVQLYAIKQLHFSRHQYFQPTTILHEMLEKVFQTF